MVVPLSIVFYCIVSVRQYIRLGSGCFLCSFEFVYRLSSLISQSVLTVTIVEHLHRADKVFALDTNGGVREQSLSEVKSEANLARITVEDDDTEELEGSANDQQASASPSPPRDGTRSLGAA